MPKIQKSEYEDADETEDTETEEEVDEMTIEEELEAAEKAPVAPKKFVQKKPMAQPDNHPLGPRPKMKIRRFGVYNIEPEQGIIDLETKEKVSNNTWDVLAQILERLERIENTVGNLLNN